MRDEHIHVLLVEDSPAMAALYQQYLAPESWRVTHAATGQAAQLCIERDPPTLMLLDLKLPDMNGMLLLERIQRDELPISVVIITAHGSVDVAIEAMRLGAFDFLEKPFSSKRLLVTLHNALKQRDLSALVENYRERFDRTRFHGFLGGSAVMQGVYGMIENAAPSKATVYITGESGTGKEVCAQAIHAESPRANKPFVAINCAAIPKDLLESEIFGHKRGAFTGAASDRQGAAARADGGVLFLDEIGELSLDLQSKLLRFLQTRMFQPVGSEQTISVDVRILCASNRDPLEEVRAGRFREDLFYRLHVVPLQLPPLREREDDVLLIANKFLAEYAREEGKRFERFADDAEARLMAHSWPGNVRELQNVVRQVAVLHDGEEATAAMLPPPLGGEGVSAVAAAMGGAPASFSHSGGMGGGDSGEGILPLWRLELQAIEQALAACQGNVAQAAARLEINPSTIYRKRQALKRKAMEE
ncbi:sigma-54-dependent transcriptional regulator [Magnetofaba australis]